MFKKKLLISLLVASIVSSFGLTANAAGQEQGVL